GYVDSHLTITHGGPPFRYPTNAAVGPNNEIYVSDGYGNARVHRFDEQGRLLSSWCGPGAGSGQRNIPPAAVDDHNRPLYTSDREDDRVALFDLDGGWKGEWTGVRRPDDLIVTSDDVVYIAELGMRAGIVAGMDQPTPTTPLSRVTVRDLNGKVLATLGAD